jgi:tetratricopeptide (TPR) repeat protein
MKQKSMFSIFAGVAGALVVFPVFWYCPSTQAQTSATQLQAPAAQSANSGTSNPEAELQTGITLTRQGHFREAIPHFLAAQGRVSEEYAENFNLALCYVATVQPKLAIELLKSLSAKGQSPATVDNLLAQAYIADDQPEKAFEALQQAAALTPRDEKLYLYVLDACMDHKSNDLGLKVANLGLRSLPRSAPLHYERALFLANLDRYDIAKGDFDRARELAPESEIAYMAGAQENLLGGNISEAIRVAREGVGKFKDNYILLQLLGEALIHSGVNPGQPEFAEAQSALEKSVAVHPDYSRSQIALGKLYLMEDRLDDAIVHLEFARELEPGNTSIYSHLATAYRRKGEPAKSQKMLSILAKLNNEQAAKIRSGPPGRVGTSAPAGVE